MAEWSVRPVVFSALALILSLGAPADAEWSRFRGTNGSGVVAGIGGLPTEFSADPVGGWKVEIPFGRSSPVVAEDRVYLTSVEGDDLVTYSLDLATGKRAWRAATRRARTADLYRSTDAATPTPVADRNGVVVFFQELGLLAYDTDGRERWRLPLGPFRNYYGMASSPVLVGDLVLLLCDQAGGSFMLGVDRTSGSIRWRRERPKRLESYSTPILYPSVERPEQVLVAGSRYVDAYAPATGQPVWSLSGIGAGPIASPVLSGDWLFVATISHTESGWHDYDELLADHDANEDGELSRPELEGMWLANHFGWVDVDGDGSLSRKDWTALTEEMSVKDWGATGIRIAPRGKGAEIVWNYKKNVPYIPSPIVHDGLLYLVHDGVLSALEPESGTLVKRDRLTEGSPKVYASPVAADGRLYFATLPGEIVVVEPGRDWSVVARSVLDDEIWATPAVTDDGIILRTRQHLLFHPARGAVPSAVEAHPGPARDGR